MVHNQKRHIDLLQVVNFAGLLQLVKQWQQTLQCHKVATCLFKSSMLQLAIYTLVKTC